MARTRKEEAPDYDRDVWEYVTYAPGHKCSVCTRTVKSLEVVVRRVTERVSSAPAVVYRHYKCPKTEAVAA